ncbi:MAG TPA: 3-dehydroquinate synthase [Gemmatimonadaceae bacterium]|nr:3-dehydroquinate synthase [Gemmatimonadaceae bacterium]
MRTIDTLGYPIVVASGGLAQVARLVEERAPSHRYAIITDDNVAPHYLDHIVESLVARSARGVTRDRVHTVVIPAGEQHKTRERWSMITDALLAHGCARDTAIIALGGGVVGDLAGFVAATYMRGIPVVQIPTTLLAMVDASVGGKTAVDTPAGKNTVGAFHPPAAVIIDPATLASLPERELRSGLAEVIKHGVIADGTVIEEVEAIAPAVHSSRTSREALEAIIGRSVQIKADVVAADERERGPRKVLNFGHTIGHGVEAASDYTLLHGEAIAIGMVAEARLAENIGIATVGTAAAIEGAVTRVGLPSRAPSDIAPDRVLSLMRSDKKQRRGVLEYSLPKRVGEMAGESSGWAIAVEDSLALEVIRTVC